MPGVGDELVEIVDENGEVTRVVTRAEMRRDNLRHRNVAIFVQRTDGRLVVHQRAAWKDVYPSHWDVAFGGVPNVGESAEDAAIRELAEETGLVVAVARLIDLGARTHTNDEVAWHARFFAVRTDDTIEPVDGEVQQIDAVPVGDVRRWAASKQVCPDALSLLDDLEQMLAG